MALRRRGVRGRLVCAAVIREVELGELTKEIYESLIRTLCASYIFGVKCIRTISLRFGFNATLRTRDRCFAYEFLSNGVFVGT